MTSINRQVGDFRKEVDYQNLCPALLIASSLVRAIRTVRRPMTQRRGWLMWTGAEKSRLERTVANRTISWSRAARRWLKKPNCAANAHVIAFLQSLICRMTDELNEGNQSRPSGTTAL
jgi:hypothetical protein